MFLDHIVAATQKRLESVREGFTFPFEQALSKKGMSFICEIKKASPSKGLIAADFPYFDIAKDYEAAGAAAISVLTEPDFFQGSGTYLKQISQSVNTPTLRKDFILDEYQIYEAKIWGAAAVLLIAEILEEDTLRRFIHLADRLGLSALVESHSLEQLQKSLRCGARIVGVNNRNLETFEVNLQTARELRTYVPPEVLFVAESGIQTAEDVKMLADCAVDAVLIGESLMRSQDKAAKLRELRSRL